MSGTFKFLLILILGGAAAFVFMPRDMKHEMQDTVMRVFAPQLDLPPDAAKPENQTSWIAEYRNRGYKLKCYDGLGPEEKIDKSNDYLCWGLIKSAYDNVPARSVAFYFSRQELRHVKVEFPDSSFAALQDYLGRRLARYPRLDEDPQHSFSPDIYGRPVMVWATPGGLVVTSKRATDGKPITLLWSSMRSVAPES